LIELHLTVLFEAKNHRFMKTFYFNLLSLYIFRYDFCILYARSLNFNASTKITTYVKDFTLQLAVVKMSIDILQLQK
jgi:hypothetical protein